MTRQCGDRKTLNTFRLTMSDDYEVKNLKDEVWGVPGVPGLSKRMDRVEVGLDRLVQLEEKRSAWASKIITAGIIFGLLQLMGATFFFVSIGFKFYVAG